LRQWQERLDRALRERDKEKADVARRLVGTYTLLVADLQTNSSSWRTMYTDPVVRHVLLQTLETLRELLSVLREIRGPCG
jgi:hypothetical protein